MADTEPGTTPAATQGDDPRTQRPDDQLPRIWAGEGKIYDKVMDYTVLIPADHDIEQTALMRLVVADVLRRNGFPADDSRIAQITEANRREDGNFDFDREKDGSTMARRRQFAGATGPLDGKIGTGFEGYSMVLRKDFQDGVLAWDQSLRGPPLGDKSAESYDKMIGIIEQLKRTAGAADNAAAKEALDTLAQALKASQNGTALDGVGAGATSFKTVAELINQISEVSGDRKLALQGAELLGRAASVLTLPVDATKVGSNVYKLWHGVDEAGKTLSATDVVKIGTELVDDGLSVTTGAAQAFRVGASLTGRTAAFEAAGGVLQKLAPIGGPASAVLGWIELNREVVRLGGEAIQTTMQAELRNRFAPGKSLSEAVDFLDRQERRVAAMPVNAGNALSSAERIMRHTFVDNGETQARFVAYLKRMIDPDSHVQRILSGKDIDKIPVEDLPKIAKAAKEAVPAFIKRELEDVKNYVLKSGPKDRGEYLRGAVESDGQVPRMQDGRNPRPLLSERENPDFALYSQVLQLGQTQATQRGLSQQQWENTAASLTAKLVEERFGGVDAVMFNREGRVFAVQGERDAVDQRRAYVDPNAANQSVEKSTELTAQVNRETQNRAAQQIQERDAQQPSGGRTV